MKKEKRIRKNEEFQEIISHSKSVANECFVMYFYPKKEDENRIGISVSKKLGNAVTRNLIKRQLRMLLQESDALQQDDDLIVIVRRKFTNNDYATNKKRLESLIKSYKMK